MNYRRANENDLLLLAELNHQLICDEGHRNTMTVAELAERMGQWLAGDYQAVVFEDAGNVLGYALYREEQTEIYLRQFFVVRDHRREGIGRQAISAFRAGAWPTRKRLTVEVLVQNQAALAFWRAVGYNDYSVTLEILPE
jgi:predicted acetyltransferase